MNISTPLKIVFLNRSKKLARDGRTRGPNIFLLIKLFNFLHSDVNYYVRQSEEEHIFLLKFAPPAV